MKLFRYVIWGLVFVLGVFLAYSTMNWTMNKSKGTPPLGRAAVGGKFTAKLTDGRTITQEDIKGKPHVMFFGFTHCPDVCPTTLYEAGQWLEALGDEAINIQIYFVTVDPTRDTAAVLGEYLTGFDKRIKGITGTEEQIAAMAKTWRVFAQKEGGKEDYNINHTATTYLMNSKGNFVRTIAYGEDTITAVTKLRKLIAEDG
ncbi:MAG: SCO family protein [Rhizobiaceae bacterium]